MIDLEVEEKQKCYCLSSGAVRDKYMNCGFIDRRFAEVCGCLWSHHLPS